jgi:FkbM family methyltransferase
MILPNDPISTDSLRRLPNFTYWIHRLFLTTCRVLRVTKRVRNWQPWQLWYRWAFPIFDNSHWLTRSSHGFWMEVRPSYLGDLTAAFGRPEERGVAEVIGMLNSGSVFVDVGAHIGRYSLLAAKTIGLTGSVIAIEPDQDNFDLLCSNHARNYLSAQTFRVAAGDSEGSVSLLSGSDSMTKTMVPDWFRIANPHHRQTSAQVETMPMVCLDSLLDALEVRTVDLLKIDVEGAELQVLDGTFQSLLEGRIRAVVCEVHQPAVKLSDVIVRLERFGLSLVNVDHGEVLAKLERPQ